MTTTHAIKELLRLPSPAPLPLGLAADGDTLWMASRETHRVYAIDTKKWTVGEEAQAPGGPFGMTMVGDEIRVVIGHGFKNDRITCPDLTGSHVGFDGDTLFLSQASYRKILALDAQGNIVREISLERTPVGMAITDGCFYLITGDEEFENLELWRVDAHNEQPEVAVLASIPFDARGLAFDGSKFWTSHRDNNEIVAFEKP
jgi:hypothetical protein